MAKWVYKKYNIGYTAWVSMPQVHYKRQYGSSPTVSGYADANWNGTSGKYVVSGVYKTVGMNQGAVYNVTNGELRAAMAREDVGYDSDGYHTFRTTSSMERAYVRSTYVGEVIVEDGSLPENGVIDGFWYVRDRQAFPEMWCNINGTNRKAVEGWVNINGAWRVISDIWVNINGAWRKS